MRIHWWSFIISWQVLKRWFLFTPVFNSCTWSIKKAFLFTLFGYVRYSSYRKDTLMLDSFPMFNSFQSKLTLIKAINESLRFLFKNLYELMDYKIFYMFKSISFIILFVAQMFYFWPMVAHESFWSNVIHW